MTIRRTQFRRRRTSSGDVSAEMQDWLREAEKMPMVACIPGLEDRVAAAWRACSGDIVSGWITERPGTRPRGWWIFEAPEQVRQRLGGVGDAQVRHSGPSWQMDQRRLWECLDFGLPRFWTRPPHVTARGYGVAHDPADPPAFESQAAYLDRHGILTPAERGKLSAAEFVPITLIVRDGVAVNV